MTTQTVSLPDGLAPLRVNVLVALYDLASSEVFVGDLVPRPNNVRHYTASMIEGGLEQGENLETAIKRELLEEIGITNAIHLATLTKPVVCYFEDWRTATKYSGKINLVCAYGIHNRNQINLNCGADKEGATFTRGYFMPLEDAEAYMQAKTLSVLRKNFFQETVSLLAPIEQALATLRDRNPYNPSFNAVLHALPHEKAMAFSAYPINEFPMPERHDPCLMTPSRQLFY